RPSVAAGSVSWASTYAGARSGPTERRRAASISWRHDPKTFQWRLQAVLAKGGPEDRQAPQPRHLRDPRRSAAARARRAVLQAQGLRPWAGIFPKRQTTSLR